MHNSQSKAAFEGLGTGVDLGCIKSALHMVCSEFGSASQLNVPLARQGDKRQALCFSFLRMEKAEQEQQIMRFLKVTSRTFSTNNGSLERLKVSPSCGCKPAHPRMHRQCCAGNPGVVRPAGRPGVAQSSGDATWRRFTGLCADTGSTGYTGAQGDTGATGATGAIAKYSL